MAGRRRRPLRPPMPLPSRPRHGGCFKRESVGAGQAEGAAGCPPSWGHGEGLRRCAGGWRRRARREFWPGQHAGPAETKRGVSRRMSRALAEDGGALGPCGLLAGASGQLLSVPATAGTVLADTQGPEQGRVRAPDLSSSWVGATFRGPTGARHSCDGARSGSWDSPHSPSRPSVPRGPPEEGHPGEGPQEVGGSHFASSRSGFCGSEEGRALPGVVAFRGRCGGGVRCVALGQRGGRARSGRRSRAAVVAAGSPLAWTPRSEGRP